MSELENSKAELEEGVVMTITIFNLPKGEEELVPDSDGEGDPPVGDKSASRSRSEDELRKEAISPEHLFSHRPKNPFCPVCQEAKMPAPQSRKVGGTRTIESKAFGDHITRDHIILKDLTEFGFHDQKDGFVIKDAFRTFRYCYPSETKTADQCHEDFLHFLQVKDDVGIVYSNNAKELIATMKKLGIRRNTSRQYVDKNKAVIEREIRTVFEGTRANLVQSGLPERYWPLASEHRCMALNTTTRLDNGKVPWQLRIGEDFSGMRIPFGAKVLFWNNPKLKAPKISKFSPAAAEGIFLGYHTQPGFIWEEEEYLVAPLDKIEGAIEANDLKVIRSKKVELLQGDFVFPLANGLEALGNQKPPQLDDQNANVRPAGVEFNEDADLAEYAPSDDEAEAKGSSEPGPIAPPASEAPRPKTGWDPFKMPDGSPVPKGYNYDGTRLVRNKRGSARPLDAPSSAWVLMSQKDRLM